MTSEKAPSPISLLDALLECDNALNEYIHVYLFDNIIKIEMEKPKLRAALIKLLGRLET